MKKIINFAFSFALACGFANAATITISAGFGAQGIHVTEDGINALGSVESPFLVSVGGYEESTYTQFANVIQDITPKINGGITGTAPTSLNGKLIHLFVGNGTTVENSTSYVILSGSAAFPTDVTVATGVTFLATVGSNLTLVDSSNANWFPALTLGGEAGNGYIQFGLIPEPSAALLGAIGALGLLRRRRN